MSHYPFKWQKVKVTFPVRASFRFRLLFSLSSLKHLWFRPEYFQIWIWQLNGLWFLLATCLCCKSWGFLIRVTYHQNLIANTKSFLFFSRCFRFFRLNPSVDSRLAKIGKYLSFIPLIRYSFFMLASTRTLQAEAFSFPLFYIRTTLYSEAQNG